VSIDAGTRRFVAGAAIFDLLSVGLLAFPFASQLQLDNLYAISGALGIVDSNEVFKPTHMLFVNLFGMLVLVWCAARLFFYQTVLLKVDMAVRGATVPILVWYAFFEDVHDVIYAFIFADAVVLIWGALHLRRNRIASLV
jgi:hypothetical protein